MAVEPEHNYGNVGENRMTRKIISSLVAACLMVGVGPAFAWDAASQKNAEATIAEFKRADPDMDAFFKNAYGYAIFPEITKGGFVVGGAGGDGTVFEQGAGVGSSEMSQVTVGLQAGGQTYREAIFFKDKAALDNFKKGNFELAAEASAVAVKTGASKTADYANGVAIFTMAKGGLMFEASVGGQKFTYEPK
jgi:lipid-binding SYLF domain-containing protein